MALSASPGLLEVVFSFDTTGSMYGCLEQVRGRIKDMIQRLQCDIPGIKTAVFAHGDYCDASIYVTKWIDFTSNVVELCDFVTDAQRTSGGDGPECYELVLHQVRTELTWTPGSRRVLVLLGDDEPHGVGYPANTKKIDWKQETKNLAMMGVTIYPVQCGGDAKATVFYKTLATATGGKHLKLADFNNLFHVLMAVCYKEGNDTSLLASYEKEMRAGCGTAAIGTDVDAIFASLRNEDASTSPAASDISASTVSPPASISGITKSKSPPRKGRLMKTSLKSPSRRRSTLKGKACTKRTSALDRYRQDNLPLLKRENVPETNFKLRTLAWSPWRMVLSLDPTEGAEDQWTNRRGSPGYRLKYLPEANKPGRSLFEISVQTPGSDRMRHVVYSSFSERCFQTGQWETRLLRRVREQVNKLLSGGCNIFLRSCLLSARDNVLKVKRDLKTYDYAWKAIRNIRSTSRPSQKGSHQISMDCS